MAPPPPPDSVAPTRLNTSIVAADLFLIREAVVGGGAGQVHLSQAASLPVLLPPPRERSTAVTGKLHCTVQKKKGRRRGGGGQGDGGEESCSTSPPPPRSKRMKRASERSHCAVSLARPQFQTSLDHFSCSPEMNNAHINWLPVNKFPSRCAIFFLHLPPPPPPSPQ